MEFLLVGVGRGSSSTVALLVIAKYQTGTGSIVHDKQSVMNLETASAVTVSLCSFSRIHMPAAPHL